MKVLYPGESGVMIIPLEYIIHRVGGMTKWYMKTLVTPKHVQKIHWPIYHFTANRFTGYLEKTKDYRNKRASSSDDKKYFGWSILKTLLSSFIHLEWLEGVNGLYLTIARALERQLTPTYAKNWI